MAISYLLDTNTFSYIINGASPAARAEFARLAQEPGAVLCISAITEAEVRFGMAKRLLSPARCSAIEKLFACLRILPWGSNEAAAYAQARTTLEAQGIAVADMDMLIASQAIAAGAVLVAADKIFAKMDGLVTTVNWARDL